MADIYRFYRYLKEVLIEDDVIFQNNLFAYALTIQNRNGGWWWWWGSSGLKFVDL